MDFLLEHRSHTRFQSRYMSSKKPKAPLPDTAHKAKITNKAVEKRKTKELKLRQFKRTDMFLEEYLKNGGNATEAAMVVFNPSTRASAAVMGSRILKQAKEIGRIYLETKGVGYGKLLDVAVENMEKSKKTEWWDRLMAISGHENPVKDDKNKMAPGIVQIIGGQQKMLEKYILEGDEPEEGEVVDED